MDVERLRALQGSPLDHERELEDHLERLQQVVEKEKREKWFL